jgi:uncharacterized protein
MKICIVSDSHDQRQLLEAAVRDACAWGAQAIVHCGDVVAPGTLTPLQKYRLPVHVIQGNNAGDVHMLARLAMEPQSVIHFHGQDAGLELAGRRVFVVHYPHYARAMACTGEWDLVCCGHDHKAGIERVPHIKGGSTLLLNPGTVGAVGAPATCILGDLESLTFCIHAIGAELPASGPAAVS